MKCVVLLVLLVAAANAQLQLTQFPFNEEPLKESLHSNKVFFNVTEFNEISGVWKAINSVFHALTWESYLYSGATPYNLSCEAAAELGWDYDLVATDPRAMTIEGVDDEEGFVGRVVETGGGRAMSYDVVSFDDGLADLGDSGECRLLKPYFDWELGKTMIIFNVQFFFYRNDDGTIGAGSSRFDCQFSDEGYDHPHCYEGPYELNGVQRDGMTTTGAMFYECIAGPCLDLPGRLPGYVVTQGYIPATPLDDDSAADAGRR